MDNKYLIKIAQDLYMDPAETSSRMTPQRKTALSNYFASKGHKLNFTKSPGLAGPSPTAPKSPV